MSWKAGDSAENNPTPKSKRSVYLILGGIVVTGVVALWRWIRDLPK